MSASTTSAAVVEVMVTEMRTNFGPSYVPTARTRSPASSTPRRRATWANAKVRHEATDASSRSVGWGPVSVPPADSGSSTTMSNSPASTTARMPPSQRATTVRSSTALVPHVRVACHRADRVPEALDRSGRDARADLARPAAGVQDAGAHLRGGVEVDHAPGVDAQRRTGVVPRRECEPRARADADGGHLLGHRDRVVHGAAEEPGHC